MTTATRRLACIVLACSMVLPAAKSVGGVAASTAAPTLAHLVGQKLVVAMAGTSPSLDLLGRISRGEVGGVILFGSNISSAAQLRALTAKLASAAVSGGQPPLLIATDQEGGTVKRLPWAPPTISVPEMGRLGKTETASSQGEATGYVLRCAGVNADFAPVADVPASTGSFMYQQGRTWSFSSATTAALSDAFASGLQAGGMVPSMKHFPGIGLATQNTDAHVVTITASKAQLAPGLVPYQTAIAHGIPLIMLANATYTAYDSANAAGWSRAITVDLLRTTLGFKGVTITDSLTGTAAARGVSPTPLAIRAAQAGTDMLLVTGSEAATKATFNGLLQAAQAGSIAQATLQASYDRILGLKAKLKGAVADAAAPKVATPVSRLYAPSTIGSTTAPVRTSWSAADPCGISASTLERQLNGRAWSVQSLPRPTVVSTAQSLAFGATYRYVVKATDGAGNRSGWSYGQRFEPLVRESSSAVSFAGAWSTVGSSLYSGGSTRYTSTRAASATYSFTGSSIGWVSAVGPTRGSANVYIDGVLKSTVSLYAPTASLRRIVFVYSWQTQGTHTIRIGVVGTPGHPRVDVDAFVRLLRT